MHDVDPPFELRDALGEGGNDGRSAPAPGHGQQQLGVPPAMGVGPQDARVAVDFDCGGQATREEPGDWIPRDGRSDARRAEPEPCVARPQMLPLVEENERALRRGQGDRPRWQHDRRPRPGDDRGTQVVRHEHWNTVQQLRGPAAPQPDQREDPGEQAKPEIQPRRVAFAPCAHRAPTPARPRHRQRLPGGRARAVRRSSAPPGAAEAAGRPAPARCGSDPVCAPARRRRAPAAPPGARAAVRRSPRRACRSGGLPRCAPRLAVRAPGGSGARAPRRCARRGASPRGCGGWRGRQ